MASSSAFNIMKNAYRLQELMIRLTASRHPAVEHSLDKVRGMKRAFHFVNHEGVEGDYVEFGMFEGASFIGALQCHLATAGDPKPVRKFYGFDSFDGLRYDAEDEHHRAQEGEFATDYLRVQKRIRRAFGTKAEWEICKGFLDDTIGQGKAPKIDKIAVAMFDLDLGEPTKVALDYVRPALQEGSVLLFDEPFFFKGHPDRGEAGAFDEFQQAHPELEFRRYCDYGFGGRAYILGKIGQPAAQIAAA